MERVSNSAQVCALPKDKKAIGATIRMSVRGSPFHSIEPRYLFYVRVPPIPSKSIRIIELRNPPRLISKKCPHSRQVKILSHIDIQLNLMSKHGSILCTNTHVFLTEQMKCRSWRASDASFIGCISRTESTSPTSTTAYNS